MPGHRLQRSGQVAQGNSIHVGTGTSSDGANRESGKEKEKNEQTRNCTHHVVSTHPPTWNLTYHTEKRNISESVTQTTHTTTIKRSAIGRSEARRLCDCMRCCWKWSACSSPCWKSDGVCILQILFVCVWLGGWVRKRNGKRYLLFVHVLACVLGPLYVIGWGFVQEEADPDSCTNLFAAYVMSNSSDRISDPRFKSMVCVCQTPLSFSHCRMV